jgi:hypothetical protein
MGVVTKKIFKKNSCCVYVSVDHLIQTTPTKFGQEGFPCQNSTENSSL